MTLQHLEVDSKDDVTLRREAKEHLASRPGLQLVAEVLTKLHRRRVSWWTPEQERSWWSATDRMRWLALRADLRQKVTTTLTGLAVKHARKQKPDFQASLVDGVIEDGDATVRQFEEAFDAADLVVYGPAHEIWQRFRERMPWDQDTAIHQEMASWLLKTLLAAKSPSIEGVQRKPILGALEVRAAIPAKVWHTHVPLETRAAIDEAQFEHERKRPSEPFHAAHVLAIATPEVICANIPLRELLPIVDAAEKAMGLQPVGATGVMADEPSAAAGDASELGGAYESVDSTELKSLPPESAAPPKSEQPPASRHSRATQKPPPGAEGAQWHDESSETGRYVVGHTAEKSDPRQSTPPSADGA